MRRLAARSTLAASSVSASSSCPIKWSPRWCHTYTCWRPSRGRPSISSTSSLEAAWVSSPAASPPVVVTGITGPWTRPGDPVAEETPARGSVGTSHPSKGGGVGALPPPSATFLGGGVPIASSTLVGLLAAVLVEAGSSSVLSGTAAAAGCSAVCGAASSAAQAGSVTLWPVAWSGLTSDAVLKNKAAFSAKKNRQST